MLCVLGILLQQSSYILKKIGDGDAYKFKSGNEEALDKDLMELETFELYGLGVIYVILLLQLRLFVCVDIGILRGFIS